MHLLFLFFDGIGLGQNDPSKNPFAAAELPTLTRYTAGKKWLIGLSRIESVDAVFIPTVASLGINGQPKSTTCHDATLTRDYLPPSTHQHSAPRPRTRHCDS